MGFARIAQSVNSATDPSASFIPYIGSDGGTYQSYGSLTWPSGAYDSNTKKTWVCWGGWNGANRNIRVKVYDHVTHSWGTEYNVGTDPLSNDDHGAPSIVRDAGGYWHIFGGAHASNLHYWTTNNIDDPSAWTEQSVIADSVTYPKPILFNNKIYLFVRGASADVESGLNLYVGTVTSGSISWASPISLADLGAGKRFYHGNILVKGTDFHIPFANASTSANPSVPFDIHYIVYHTSNGSMSKIDGTSSVASNHLPADCSTNTYRIHTSAGTTTSDVPGMCFDSSGNPHIIDYEGPTGGTVFTVFHLYYNGSAWTSTDTLGTSCNSAGQTALSPASDGGVDAFWEQLPQNGSAYSITGGDIWTAHWNGSWQPSRRLMTAYNFALSAPSPIFNATTDLRMAFFEVLQASADNTSGIGTTKGFAWGDRGFI